MIEAESTYYHVYTIRNRRAFGDVHNNLICSAKKLHVGCFEIVTPSSSPAVAIV